ncbi:MAG TPA: TadE family protein [Terracidiphilus sp.]|nr:TadE family protein [Terracidiphilus sp.]
MMRASGSGQKREEGSALVETALSISVMLTVMVGIMQLCLVMYASVFVNEAAREATRYASVRGSNSCTDLSTFPNCNLGPTSSPISVLTTYVQGLGYPLPNTSNLQVTTASWNYVTLDGSGFGYSQWTSAAACTGASDPGPSGTPPGGGNPCNYPGNMVTVQVQYAMPLNIPFWTNANVTLTSQSSMLIAN